MSEVECSVGFNVARLKTYSLSGNFFSSMPEKELDDCVRKGFWERRKRNVWTITDFLDYIFGFLFSYLSHSFT